MDRLGPCGSSSRALAACRVNVRSAGASPRPGPYWANLTGPTAPPARELEVMAWDAADNEIVMFGGGNWGGNYTARSDTWTFAGGQWTEWNVSTHPPPLWGAMMAYDAKDRYVVLFGGSTPRYPLFEDLTWIWSNGTWTNITSTAGTPPMSRWLGGMAYDAADQYVVLFGGEGLFGYFNDTWEFSAGKWTNLTSSLRSPSPGPRSDVGAVYDPNASCVLLNSGTSGGAAINESWCYSDLNWTEYNVSVGSSGYAAASLAYLPAYSEVARWGGNFSDNGTWTFSNASWTNRSLRPFPSVRVHPAMAYDPRDGYAVLMGGAVRPRQAVEGNDTWALGSTPIFANLAAVPASADTGRNLTLRVQEYPYTGPLTVAYHGLPSGCVSQNVSVLTCDPTVAGTYSVNASITAPGGLWNTTTPLSITVTPAPAVTSFTVAPTPVTQGHSVLLEANVSGGAVPLRFSYSGLPAGCSTQNAANLTCIPAIAGTFPINVVVTDASSTTADATTTLVVDPRPAIRSLTALPPAIDLGMSVRFAVNSTGGTGTVTYRWSSLPAGCLPVDAPSFSCSPSNPGRFTVNVSVVDAESVSTNSSVVLPVNMDLANASASAASGVIDLGDSSRVTASVVGGSAPYAYQWAGLPVGCSSRSGPTISCTPLETGSFEVRVTITDSAGANLTAATVLVVHADPKVTAVGLPANGSDAGHPVAIAPAVTGGTPPFEYRYPLLPVGCTGANLSVLVCTPTVAQTVVVQVSVTDSRGRTATASGSLRVNPALQITGLTASPANSTVGQPVLLAVELAGGTLPITLTYRNLPSGCSSLNESPLACTFALPGTFTVVVFATDADGENATSAIAIHVSAASASPGTRSGLLVALLAAVAVAGVGALVALWVRRRRRAPAESEYASDAVAGEEMGEPEGESEFRPG